MQHTGMAPATERRPDVRTMDPYAFFAVLGKRVIHPGGRRSTEQIFELGQFSEGQRVLDIGCGVGTTAIQLASRFGVEVAAVDISPLMLDRAEHNVRRAGVSDRVTVQRGDILALPFPDASFDRVIAEAVTMFVDRERAAKELVRVVRPGGMVLATEFFWRRPPTPRAREAFLGQLCPGMLFDTEQDWLRIYRAAGLEAIELRSGPFEMMTFKGFLADEGIAGVLRFMAHGMSRPSYARKLAWVVPRVARAVPYLGYLAVAGCRPTQIASIAGSSQRMAREGGGNVDVDGGATAVR
jgi:ubiquinone/menaquinone biosynthesis C-methylase UbiE